MSRHRSTFDVLDRTSIFMCVVVALQTLVIVACAAAQQVATWESLVKRINDSSGKVAESLAAWKSLDELPTEQRQMALQQLLLSRNPGVAPRAASFLIHENAPNAGPLVAAQFTNWDPTAQQGILRRIVLEQRAASMPEPARRVLQDLIANAALAVTNETYSRTVNIAAAILRDSDEAEDQSLAISALRVYPASHNLWLTAARSELGDAERSLATSVYVDPRAGLLARFAAAIAIAPSSVEADAFVTQYCNAFLDKYAARHLDELVNGRTSGDHQAAQEYDEFTEKRRFISMLASLRTASAERLITRALAADNEAIRMSAALVAIERWPALMAELQQGTLSSTEFTNLLVYCAMRHPEFRESALQRISQEAFDEASKHIEEHGWILVFTPVGSDLAGL